jgi:hypothetical protein
MGMGGSGAEQQAQYHPWGVSSAILFTINASSLVPRLRCWYPQAACLGRSSGRRSPYAVAVEARMPSHQFVCHQFVSATQQVNHRFR